MLTEKIKDKLDLSPQINQQIDWITKRDYFLDQIVSIKEDNKNIIAKVKKV